MLYMCGQVMIVLTEEKKMKHLKLKLQGKGYVRDPFLFIVFHKCFSLIFLQTVIAFNLTVIFRFTGVSERQGEGMARRNTTLNTTGISLLYSDTVVVSNQ